jgi:hypothetical protein
VSSTHRWDNLHEAVDELRQTRQVAAGARLAEAGAWLLVGAGLGAALTSSYGPGRTALGLVLAAAIALLLVNWSREMARKVEQDTTAAVDAAGRVARDVFDAVAARDGNEWVRLASLVDRHGPEAIVEALDTVARRTAGNTPGGRLTFRQRYLLAGVVGDLADQGDDSRVWHARRPLEHAA